MCVCARARASYFSSVVVLIDFLFYCNFNKNTGCEVHSFLVYIHMFIKYFSTKQNLSFSCAFLLISPEYIFTGAAGCFCQYSWLKHLNSICFTAFLWLFTTFLFQYEYPLDKSVGKFHALRPFIILCVEASYIKYFIVNHLVTF